MFKKLPPSPPKKKIAYAHFHWEIEVVIKEDVLMGLGFQITNAILSYLSAHRLLRSLSTQPKPRWVVLKNRTHSLDIYDSRMKLVLLISQLIFITLAIEPTKRVVYITKPRMPPNIHYIHKIDFQNETSANKYTPDCTGNETCVMLTGEIIKVPERECENSQRKGLHKCRVNWGWKSH